MAATQYIGWKMAFRKNTHMYCHTLRASKDGRVYDVPCEDGASVDGMLMWPYELNLDDLSLSGLVQALHEWADSEGLKYRIYITRDHFEGNVIP